MARPPSDARDRVLTAAIRQLRRAGAGPVTLDGVASDAACAKGLLTYHFGSKDKLLLAATEEILRDRELRWQRALDAQSLEATIQATWQALLDEVRDGFWRAWLSLALSKTRVISQAVSNHGDRFAGLLRDGAASQMRDAGLEPTVKLGELAQFLSSGVQGIGMQLAVGVRPELLEGAHSALWIAVLGMTRPAE